jgi:phosphoribosylformylglycinamidine synthase subunit PurL
MAFRAGTGIELDLSLVPQRETDMTAYEMLLSESQERMLIVAHSGREREVIDIFRKWDLDAVVIGRVREGANMRVIHQGETVADIPVSFLNDEAPMYERPMKAGSPKSKVQSPKSEEQGTQHEDQKFDDALVKLLASPNLASKQFVYRQYDHMVRTNTAVLPGADAAVVRIKETRRALAMSLDGNGRYCAADPREGAKLIVAEAARNVVCVGARPLAVTNCLNFASPERPEVMWSFSEVIDGMAEACRAFNTPVVSGNVSFYNETEGRGILPTPVIGMIGLLEDVRRVVQPGFKTEGDVIALLERRITIFPSANTQPSSKAPRLTRCSRTALYRSWSFELRPPCRPHVSKPRRRVCFRRPTIAPMAGLPSRWRRIVFPRSIARTSAPTFPCLMCFLPMLRSSANHHQGLSLAFPNIPSLR